MTPHKSTRERRRETGAADISPQCSRCDNINDRAPQRYCSECHAQYQRDWRKTRVNVSRETFCFMKTRAGL